MMISNSITRYPVTICLSLAVIAIHFVPGLTAIFQLDFVLVAEGQWWRVWTGHLTHFGSEHLCWDLIMFVGLAGACERMRSRQMLPAMIVMAAGISLAIEAWCPEIVVYRGLSGIDTGLFVWLAGMNIGIAIDQRDRLAALLWITPCVGLVGKLAYELLTGQTLFVSATGFVPLVEAHLTGVVMGAALCIHGRLVNTTWVRYRLPSR